MVLVISNILVISKLLVISNSIISKVLVISNLINLINCSISCLTYYFGRYLHRVDRVPAAVLWRVDPLGSAPSLLTNASYLLTPTQETGVLDINDQTPTQEY